MRTAKDTGRLPAGVWLAAAGAGLLLLAVSARYGFHRDELYFIVAGRHLDWGFVDQPPLTPLVARISELIAGPSPVALRVLPAVAVMAVVVMTAGMARRFGGGRVAQVVAAAASAGTGVLLGEGHLLSTAVFDYAAWTAGLLVLVQLLDDGDERGWLVLGLIVGVGMQNKHTIAFFAVAVVLSLLAVDRHRLASPLPWVGAAIAWLLAAPNLAWQVANGWPQLEMAEALRDRSDGPLAFVALQPALLSVTLAIPAAAGFWRLLRAPQMRVWRSIAVAYVVLFVAFLATGGKAYYIAPMYPALLAAGAVWFEDLGRTARMWLGAAMGLGIVFGLFIALPLLPPAASGTLDATGELAETIGWPSLVGEVAAVYESLPPDQRENAVVFTASYGSAGAVDVLGDEFGLPAAASGHNTYWLWGPPQRHGAIIGVGWVDDVLRPICPNLEVASTIDNPYGVSNEAAGLPVWMCAAPSGTLRDVWDQARHYN